MAVRLTVVLSQSSMRDNHAAELEQSLIAEVMMTPGLDATMLGPLEHVNPDDTDFLCVSSFNHSIALVSWLAAEEVDVQWQRLGLEGEIVSVTKERWSAPAAARRIYHIQMTDRSTVADILASLKKVLSERNVRTVDIGLPSASKLTPTPTMSKQSAKQEPKAITEQQPRSEPELPDQESDEDWPHLDRLVDEFEAFDL